MRPFPNRYNAQNLQIRKARLRLVLGYSIQNFDILCRSRDIWENLNIGTLRNSIKNNTFPIFFLSVMRQFRVTMYGDSSVGRPDFYRILGEKHTLVTHLLLFNELRIISRHDVVLVSLFFVIRCSDFLHVVGLCGSRQGCWSIFRFIFSMFCAVLETFEIVWISGLEKISSKILLSQCFFPVKRQFSVTMYIEFFVDRLDFYRIPGEKHTLVTHLFLSLNLELFRVMTSY